MKVNPKSNKKYSVLKNRLPLVILGVVGILLIGILGVQLYGKHLISNLVSKQLPDNLELTYEDLDLDILFGNMEFNSMKLKFFSLKTKKTEAEITIETLKIKDVAYWLLLNKKQFNTDAVNVGNADVIVFKKDSDSIKCSVENVSFELSKFKTDSLLLQNKIPFDYYTSNLLLTNLYLDLGRFEMLKVATLSYKNNNLKFEDLSITSKYKQQELSEKLVKEHDYVDFKVTDGASTEFRLKTVNDSFLVSAHNLSLNNSELHLFRDKLLADDTTKKLLYGTKLRNLPIQLDIETFSIENSNVFYSERVDKGIDPVSISFENLDAQIDNLSNINKQKTKIKVTTKLMGEAPLEFKWEFNSLDTADSFKASANLKDLKAVTINPFLESQANVRVLGEIHDMYFTIYGNDFKSTGDMKMKYEDFKFSILNEDRLGINKTLTALVNVFTNDGSKTDVNGYRYGDIEVERDKTKSFFNYLWLNTKDGLKNTVIGNGKK
ncbi:DUF748 domain-containing protein [Algibacter sp. L1A34]|uniref:DUF748 domain-containing protein n=1 Tax=Algibacter sp. L1A34 TaxID=2686365 RepID=UPI00131BA259|nr:DUF748 domain-containing protein [Algibacter sp. L1A34]